MRERIRELIESIRKVLENLSKDLKYPEEFDDQVIRVLIQEKGDGTARLIMLGGSGSFAVDCEVQSLSLNWSNGIQFSMETVNNELR